METKDQRKPEVFTGGEADRKHEKWPTGPTNALITVRIHSWLARQFNKNAYVKFYTFTVSPHQRYCEQLVVHSAIDQILRSYKSVLSVLCITELSDNGKYHAHGLVAAKNPSKFAKFRRHPTCQYKFEELTPGDQWFDYMSKSSPSYLYYYNRTTDPQGTSVINELIRPL